MIQDIQGKIWICDCCLGRSKLGIAVRGLCLGDPSQSAENHLVRRVLRIVRQRRQHSLSATVLPEQLNCLMDSAPSCHGIQIDM